MPNEIKKLEAHASHLLDQFIGLKEKYALLDPMLFDTEVVKVYGTNKRARGFKMLKHSLFLVCAQEIAKLCFDTDKRTPSIAKLINRLNNTKLLEQLREKYALTKTPYTEEESDPRVIELLKRREKDYEIKRRDEFNHHYDQLTKFWNSLSNSEVMNGFIIVRDKISAHTEVHYIGNEYQLVNLNSLGIKEGDMRTTIESMQGVVELLGYIIRCAGMDWNEVDRILSRDVEDFWSTTEDTA